MRPSPLKLPDLVWPRSAAFMLAVLALLGALLLPPPTATQAQPVPGERTWRLAGIYSGEMIDSPRPINQRQFLTIRRADARGGVADIEVKNLAGEVMFRQRLSWEFLSDITAFRSGDAVRQGVRYALEGDRATANPNYASIHGDGSGSNFPRIYMPPQRAAQFSGPAAVSISPSNPANGFIKIDGNSPTSGTASFYIAHSPPLAGPQWTAMWFSIVLGSGEGSYTTQFYEIHYVFTTDGTAPGALPGQGELPPGVTYHPPAGGGGGPGFGGGDPPLPPGGGGRSFPDPRINGMPVDWCLEFGAQCGQPAADRFCQSQGLGAASRWEQAASDRTIIQGTSAQCQSASRCGALRNVVCGAGSSPLPPYRPPPRPPVGMIPLKLYYGDAREDNFTTGTAKGEADALAAGYRFVRIEGYGFATQQPGTVPLKLYWNAARGDNFSTASAEGERAAISSGYSFVRVEAYIYADQLPGTVPLTNFYSPPRGDNFGTATLVGEADARNAGYIPAWIEGYVMPTR